MTQPPDRFLPRGWTTAAEWCAQNADQPKPTRAEVEAAVQDANDRLERWIIRQQYKYLPAFRRPRRDPAVSCYNHAAQPPARVTWSPRAYAHLKGLTGTAADVFTDMVTPLQHALKDLQ